MAWNLPTNGEIDANSPMHAILWGKIKDCLEALQSGGAVKNTGLDTSIQEVSVTAVSTAGSSDNIELSSVGQFGFTPQVKVNNTANLTTASVQILSGTHNLTTSYKTLIHLSITPSGIVTRTLYAQVRYIQASRDEPVVWIKRDKSTKQILSSVFDPECNGETHPFLNSQNDKGQNFEYICLQLKDNKCLCDHLYQNFHKSNSFLEQIHIGLFTGAVKLIDTPSKPRLKDKSAPALYKKDVKIVNFEFRLT